MKIHLLSGFLGSGKTTAIQKAASIVMKQGTRVGVITNDQGVKLVDNNFFKSLEIPTRQVINGCFCCNYNQLDNNIESLIKLTKPAIIFAESVGSCTDIVATVMKPLLHYRQHTEVTVSTFADARLLFMLLNGNSTSFDESVTYIFHKQLEEASIIVISKVDLMSAADLEELATMMKAHYSNKTVIFQNSLDAHSLEQWLNVLDQSPSYNYLASLEIDYDVYGAGEAMLAWLDEELAINSISNNAVEDAYDLVELIYEKITTQKLSIGHLKFLIDDKIKLSFTATAPSQTKRNAEKHSSSSASLLINARVQTSPEILSGIVAKAIQEIDGRSGSSVVVKSISAFSAGISQAHPQNNRMKF